MRPQTLVFDFDGTLADTMTAYGQAWNEVAAEYGLTPITHDDIMALRHKNAGEIMRHLGLSRLKLPLVANRMRKELNKNIGRLREFPGIREVLAELKGQERRLGILTSNSRENVSAFLRNRDLPGFDFIYSGSRIFGKSRLLKRLMTTHGLRAEETAYVCDEVRDIEAARRAQMQVLAVSWGFNSEDILLRYRPDALLRSPADLLEILEPSTQHGPVDSPA